MFLRIVSFNLIINVNLQHLKVLTLVVKKYPKSEFISTLLLSISVVISVENKMCSGNERKEIKPSTSNKGIVR